MPIRMIILLYILVLFIFVVFYLIINLKWCVKTLREIAHPSNQGGYTKLIQIGLMIILVFIFCIIAWVYIKNPTKVDRTDVILAVVVGWLGLIIGRFFGERAMEALEEKQKINVDKLTTNIGKLNLLIEKYKKFIDRILPKL